MKNKVDFTKLFNTVNKMTNKRKVLTIEKVKYNDFNFINDSELLKREVSFDDIVIDRNNLLKYSGKMVVLYKHIHNKDLSVIIKNPEKGNKFHITECSTIIDSKEKDDNNTEYERYIVSNNLDGVFKIRNRNDDEIESKLYVCRNCLNSLNYKNYSFSSKKVKMKLLKTFQ